MKHFEELWEESEKVAVEFIASPEDAIKKIIELTGSINHSNKNDNIGLILLNLCYLSAKLDVNTYLALYDQMMDAKVHLLESDSDD